MIYKDEEIDLITLSALDLSPAVIKKLYNNFTYTKPNFEENQDYLIKTLSSGVYNEVRETFQSPEFRAKVLENLEKKDIICIPFFSEDYPEKLKGIKNFPPLLYCKGNISLLHTEAFGIVGSRRTSPQVLAECKKISEELSEKFTIVSGAAAGADTAALEGALHCGKTISVIACGLDCIRRDRLLTADGNGLIVTEYPPPVKAKPFYFPQRNRIIAALAKGLLVVSAAKKSGALITAEYAKEYKRDLFAFPYGLGVESGEGCNALIKSGAHLTESAKDIFGFYGLEYKTEHVSLSEEEQKVYEAIAESGDALLSEIADKLKIPVYKVLPIVASLELRGFAIKLGGNRYGIRRL